MNSKKNVYVRALALAVPMMIQNGITNMVSLVDNVMVGSLGTEAMTGVSIVGQLIFVFNLAIFGGVSGPAIFGAQYVGQENVKGFQNTFRMKQWISLFCLICGITIFLLFGENLIVRYLRGESSSIDAGLTLTYAKQYLWVMLFGLVPFAMTQVYAGSLREMGHSLGPMVASILSVGVDVVLNYAFIYGKLGLPKLGVQGVALATVTARVVELGLIIIWAQCFKKKYRFLDGAYKTLLIPRDQAITMVRKGLPIFLNEFLWAGSLAMLTQTYSTRGLAIVAGLNISNTICNLLNVVFCALGAAVGILVGQYLGAKEFERAEHEAFHLMWFTGGICLVLTAILIGISSHFPKLYHTTAEVQRYATVFIIITASFFPVQGFLNALYFTLRSGGKTFITFLFDSVYSWTITVPLALILCHFTGLSIIFINVIVQASDIIKVIIGYILIKKGAWISNIVGETE